MKESPGSGRLSWMEKFGYALGDAGSNFYFQFFGIFLVYYYTDVIGLSAAAVGTMMLVTRLADAVFDPLMGAIADRTRTRWGRFRPYLLWIAPVYGVAGIVMFLFPSGGTGLKLGYAYLSYSLMMFAYSAINVPYSALMGVMSASSEERNRLSSFRFIAAFGAGAIIAYAALPLKDYLGRGDDQKGFFWTMVVFAVLSVGCFLVTFFTTREHVAPMVDEKPASMLRDVRLIFTTGPWLVLFGVAIVNLTAYCVRAGAQIYYFKYAVGRESAAPVFMLTGTLAAMAGIAAGPWISRKLGKRRAMMVLLWISALAYGTFYFLPTANYPLLLAVNIIGAGAFGPAGSIVWAMYADAADHVEWRHGRRITGLVFAGVLFAIKVGVALGGALIGWLLAAYGFVPNTVPSAESVAGITLIFSIIPAALFAGAALLLLGYSLSEEKVARTELELQQRRLAA